MGGKKKFTELMQTYHTSANNVSTICTYFSDKVTSQKCQLHTSTLSWKKEENVSFKSVEMHT